MNRVKALGIGIHLVSEGIALTNSEWIQIMSALIMLLGILQEAIKRDDDE
jgi:hypothetical protein